jgi:DNA modification methylase
MLESNTIYCGDAFEILKTFPAECVDCCITSPPYWGLRNYGVAGQIGMEKTPEEYVIRLIDLFREVRRALKKSGTLWLNLGDSYMSGGGPTRHHGYCDPKSARRAINFEEPHSLPHATIKPKDLVGIPWRVALALQADGWWLRQDIIWAKPNPMPESVTDRCTKSHEYIFLLSKSDHYYFDFEAIQEKAAYDGRRDTVMKGSNKYADGAFMQIGNANSLAVKGRERWKKGKLQGTDYGGDGAGFKGHSGYDILENPYVRNKRSVWNVATKPFADAHFATFPERLVIPMMLAGVPRGGIVIDPFSGAGTTAMVARKLERQYVGIELNPEYVKMSENRIEREVGTLF